MALLLFRVRLFKGQAWGTASTSPKRRSYGGVSRLLRRLVVDFSTVATISSSQHHLRTKKQPRRIRFIETLLYSQIINKDISGVKKCLLKSEIQIGHWQVIHVLAVYIQKVRTHACVLVIFPYSVKPTAVTSTKEKKKRTLRHWYTTSICVLIGCTFFNKHPNAMIAT